MNNFKNYLFTYSYDNDQYSLEIPANSLDEAKRKLARMTFAQYEGELIVNAQALPTTGVIVKIYTWIMNKLSK